MEKLTPEQVDLVYVIYGEMQFGADVAREQGVSRQAINNRLKKIHTRLTKLMVEMDEAYVHRTSPRMTSRGFLFQRSIS